MDTKDIILARHTLNKVLRKELDKLNVVEVDTPIICPYPDIAPVKQFITTHPTKGVIGTLRIAPTEYLKRILILGLERIYEFSVNFRDEEFTTRHLSEFTSLEVMIKESDVFHMMDLSERFCKLAIEELNGSGNTIKFHSDAVITELAWENEWKRVSLPKFLYDRYGFQPDFFFQSDKVKELYREIFRTSFDPPQACAVEDIITDISRQFSEPIFVYDFPSYVGGPAQPSKFDNRFKERAELYFGGLEMANMSSTLTDPIQLRNWHVQSTGMKFLQGITPNILDEPLLADIERGLAKSAVLGLGIDRLLKTCLDIKDISQTRSFSYTKLFNNGHQ